jgi:CheY-like chemotaxis protein
VRLTGGEYPRKAVANMGDPADAPLVLVIDDDDAVLQVYQDLLIEDGFRLAVRSSPPSSVDEVWRAQPDLILLDLLFGSEQSGWDFLRMIKEEATTAAIPVVVVTANQRLVEDQRPTFEAWGCGIVLKPFDIDELSASLRRALGDGPQSED